MKTAPSSAAPNARAWKRPAPSASEVPTSTGATAAGSVRTRAAITQMRTMLVWPVAPCPAGGGAAIVLGAAVTVRSLGPGSATAWRAASSGSCALGEPGEVGLAPLAIGVATLLRLLAAVEQQVRGVGELLDAAQTVLGRVEARLQQPQRERR